MKAFSSQLLRSAVLSALLCSAASADMFVIRKENPDPANPGKSTFSEQPYNNVKIKGTKDDQLQYLSEGGNDSTKPLATIYRIEVTGENAFNDAEKAYAAGTWPEASEAYNRAIKTTTKDWMKDRISLRLIDLAGKTNRFDIAAAGYVGLVASNPTLAATVKPPLTDDKKALAAAVDAVEHALGDSKLAPEKKITLLQFELDIQNALGDKKAAGAIVETMLKTGGLNANDPAMQKQVADMKVAVAQLALDNKDYARAQSQIEESKAILNDPAQQAQALYILAESKYQLALAAKTTDKKAWQDIAISYMRVVALFPTHLNAADSLARTAACYEQMGENDKAVAVYQQVVKQYATAAAAKTSQEAINRLKPGN